MRERFSVGFDFPVKKERNDFCGFTLVGAGGRGGGLGTPVVGAAGADVVRSEFVALGGEPTIGEKVNV